MHELGSRARRLPAPPAVVWDSLARPHQPGTRAWLALAADETEPEVLGGERPGRLVWSSLWPSRPRDQVHFELTAAGGETMLRLTLLTPDDLPDPAEVDRLRHRANRLVFADLRLSYGQ